MRNEVKTCECEHTHENVLERVRELMPCEDVIYDVAELFKVFGDSTRTNVLMALFESEMCVCDISALLNMTKSAISHQLRILRQSKRAKAVKKFSTLSPTNTSAKYLKWLSNTLKNSRE